MTNKSKIDDYLKNVVALGDEGSELLARICAPTLRNNDKVRVIKQGMNGIAVLEIPDGYDVVVHAAGGNPKEKDIKLYAASVVERLIKQAKDIEAQPLAFADVIDSQKGDTQLIKEIADVLVERAGNYKLAILNGENAILGDRVVGDANISGTMISIVKKGKFQSNSVSQINSTYFAVFDPKGRKVWINSDGVGTKTEFYERSHAYHRGLEDSLAMKLDDTVKLGAIAQVVADIVETSGVIPMEVIRRHAFKLGCGFHYLIHQEESDGRVQSYKSGIPAYNISGSAVSVIDEDRLANPPTPQAGNVLIAVRGKPNPRSNGITDKRKIMIELLGLDWHEKEIGKQYLEFLATPSTMLYNTFSTLLENNLATATFHMSGGAYDGKLARPLANNGLFVSIDKLFQPDPRELTFVGHHFTSAQTAYGKWPMGNDGFVAVPVESVDKAIDTLRAHGLEGREVGTIKTAENGRTGVEIKTAGEMVYFSGR